jgi:hypothetical protein
LEERRNRLPLLSWWWNAWLLRVEWGKNYDWFADFSTLFRSSSCVNFSLVVDIPLWWRNKWKHCSELGACGARGANPLMQEAGEKGFFLYQGSRRNSRRIMTSHYTLLVICHWQQHWAFPTMHSSCTSIHFKMSNIKTCSANKGKSIEEFFNGTMLTGKQSCKALGPREYDSERHLFELMNI